jgi:hypothetical protein
MDACMNARRLLIGDPHRSNQSPIEIGDGQCLGVQVSKLPIGQPDFRTHRANKLTRHDPPSDISNAWQDVLPE